MSFIVILLCFAAQWFLTLNKAAYTFHWSDKYIAWMRKQFSGLMQGHGLFAVVTLVLPVVIVVSLVFTIIYHLFGHLGYLVLSVLLLYYYTDVALLKPATVPSSTSSLFLETYQKIFAPLFWYFVFGPVGLAFYMIVVTLRTQLPEHKYFGLTQGVLDWVPIRLLGLSFALAGNFAVVFKTWLPMVLHGIVDHQNQVVALGEAALTSDSDAQHFLRRTLLIWLVVFALITIGGLIH